MQEALTRQEYYKKYREQNLQRLRDYDKERYKDPVRKEAKRRYSRRHYENNRQQVIERTRRYREEHPDQAKAFMAAWRSSLFEIWGVSQTHLSQAEARKRGLAAQKLGTSILTQVGYEVLPISELLPMFPIDVFAKKNGTLYGIEITIYPRKKFEVPLLALLKFLGARTLCLFIRPNFSDYWLCELNGHRCISVPKKVVMEGGTPVGQFTFQARR